MDAETLTFLLRPGHLNMHERVERGLWPHPPLKFDDVLHHLIKVLETEPWFPRVWELAIPGQPVYEGGVIERLPSGKYIYRCQRAYPLNPCLLADQVEQVFTSAEAVARHYLKWDLHLPGDLDSWKVIP